MLFRESGIVGIIKSNRIKWAGRVQGSVVAYKDRKKYCDLENTSYND